MTFDDGPSPVSDQLMDILNAYQAKATFFMLGPNMKKYPESVIRMVNEGFAVGLHGMTHNLQKIYAEKNAPVKEMIQVQSILNDITGVQSEIVRLPYGSIPYLTEDMRALLKQQEFKIWDWNVDSKDWKFRNKRFVSSTIQQIERVEKANETPVVLLHDIPETVHHLPKLLNYLNQHGYQTKTITDDLVPLTFTCNGRCYSIR